jgi:uncharacterized protein
MDAPGDAAFLVLVFAGAVLSGATAAIVGFGIGSLLTPVLLTRLDPPTAVAAVAIPHLAATALRFLHHRQWVDHRVLLHFGIPSAAGSLVGAMAQSVFGGPALVAVLGALLVSTGIASLTHGFGGWRPSARTAALVGLASGLFGGLAGNQGGLRAAGLAAFSLAPRAYLATATAVALLVDAARTPVYLARTGSALAALALPIAVATAGCLAGTVAGERLFFRIPPARYRMLVGAAVLALGVWLLATAA